MTDVVVVGGGIIGLATARALCLRGAKVTVLEEGMVASGTSSRGEGNMLVSDKEIPAEATLALRSLELWRRFSEESTQPFEFEEKGGIITARTEHQLQLLGEQADRQKTLGSGIISAVLDQGALREAEPNLDRALVGGIHYPQDAQVMPIQAGQALAVAAQELGAVVRTGVKVAGMSRRGRGVALQTSTGEVLADLVVNATGPWAQEVAVSLGGHVAVFPRRGVLLVTERMPPGTVRHKVYDGRYVEAVGSDEAAAQVAPVVESTQAGTILVGSTREAVGWDTSVPWGLVGQLATEAATLFPVLSEAVVIRTYQGFRPATPDHLPLIGPDQHVEGLFHHTGHEGAGIGLALGSAELLADAVLEGRVDPAFDPRRFGSTGSGVGVAGASIGGASIGGATAGGATAPGPVVLSAQGSVDERDGSATAAGGIRSQPITAGEGVGSEPAANSPSVPRPAEMFCAIGHCFACVTTDDGQRTERTCLTRPTELGEGSVRAKGGARAAPAQTAGQPVRDIVVVGAGPGGMTAATWAAKSGADVLMLDRYPRPGGQIARQPAEQGVRPVGPYAPMIEGIPPQVEVWGGAEVTVLRALDTGFQILLLRDGELMDVRARTVVLATGAREVVQPFPGWTLPGVMTVGGVQARLKREGAVPAKRIGLAGTGPLLLAVAAALSEAGAPLQMLSEQQSFSRLATQVPSLGWAFRGKGDQLGRLGRGVMGSGARGSRFGWRVAEAVGGSRLRAVVMEKTDGSGKRRSFSLDILGVSGALIPDIGLAAGLGCATRPGNGGAMVVVDDDQQTTVTGVYAVGEMTGVGGADKSVAEGYVAGMTIALGLRDQSGRNPSAHAAADLNTKSDQSGPVHVFADSPEVRRQAVAEAAKGRAFAERLGSVWPFDHSWADRVPADTIVCRCEGVPIGAVRKAMDQGARTPRAIKGLTRCGMGYCQGAVCGPLLASATANASSRSAPSSAAIALEHRPLAVPVPLCELARLRDASPPLSPGN